MSARAWLLSTEPRGRRQAWFGQTYRLWLRFSANYLAVSGLAIVVAVALVALLAPVLAPYDPYQQALANRLMPPSETHVLGTDELGRDTLSRLIWGARTSYIIILMVLVLVPPIGLGLGCVSGFAGGIVDGVIMRITDAFLAFPKLILALAFVAVLGPGIINAVLAIAITSWPAYARIARAEALQIRESEYVLAARLYGASTLRIVLRHIMPMCTSSLIVRLTTDMAGVILIAAGLGFLGLGAQPPTAEWGAMIGSGRRYVLDQWWLATLPGVAICVLSLGFNLLGDGLRDVLDPRQP